MRRPTTRSSKGGGTLTGRSDGDVEGLGWLVVFAPRHLRLFGRKMRSRCGVKLPDLLNNPRRAPFLFVEVPSVSEGLDGERHFEPRGNRSSDRHDNSRR